MENYSICFEYVGSCEWLKGDMEYCNGTSLADVFDKAKSMDSDWKIKSVMSTADGVKNIIW